MSDDYLVRHCAPTLAGIKTGSIFTCPYESKDALLHMVRGLNKRLASKGLRILPLRLSEKKALIYIFRPKCLSRDLSDAVARDVLIQHGYDTVSCEKCIVQLVKRLRLQKEFPHEIGLFLGYPPGDVLGFMRDPEACLYSGCWKVYENTASAQALFAQYKRCTQNNRDRLAEGFALDSLIRSND